MSETETYAELTDHSLAELKDFFCVVAPAKRKLPRRERHSGGKAIIVKRKFEKYVGEVHHDMTTG